MPFIRRWERKWTNVLYLELLHGRSARFRNFQKSVGRTISDICADCELETDSNEHKLLYCKPFDCKHFDTNALKS